MRLTVENGYLALAARVAGVVGSSRVCSSMGAAGWPADGRVLQHVGWLNPSPLALLPYLALPAQVHCADWINDSVSQLETQVGPLGTGGRAGPAADGHRRGSLEVPWCQLFRQAHYVNAVLLVLPSLHCLPSD